MPKHQNLASIALRSHQSPTGNPLGSNRRRAKTPRRAAQRPLHRMDPASLKSKRGAAPIARQRFARRPQENLIRIRKRQHATNGAWQQQSETVSNGKLNRRLAAPGAGKSRAPFGWQTIRQRRRLTWKCRSAAAQNRAFCETPRRFAPSSTALRVETPLSRRCFKTFLVERGAAQTTRQPGCARAPVRPPHPPPPRPSPIQRIRPKRRTITKYSRPGATPERPDRSFRRNKTAQARRKHA